MFLNDIGQPLILNSKKTYGPYEQHNGPMLLTSAAFQDHIVPTSWCGRIIGSAHDVARFQGQNEYYGPAILYYLKNDCIRSLIADNLSGYLDFIPKSGATFHRAIGNGIDVLYFDDLCYASEEDEALAQREYIYAFIQLIRPKYLYGLRQDKLPKYLLDLCA
ncbi:uncharacterized protein LOC111600632 isoform X3 [Drosophila hydei]|uniref:Uncharacterized protein LOC111600632 isoform X3 n=1 Tax=Drosophila hydei TaxID=7224 RepID=A0A6J1LYV2_DROHY|nr:uncharacterized protein LOC111600632 isoform X3 [Drosophila hydei]